MKPSRLIIFLFLSWLLISCADSKNLESIKITPELENANDTVEDDVYVCDSAGDDYRQFEAIGIYSDDSEKDFTDEVTWSSDASSDDIYISDSVNGLVWCKAAYGKFGISATYTVSTGDSSTTDEDSSNEFTDSAIVDAI